MSLAIDTTRVSAVLLSDGWHTVKEGTFTIDAYEYVDGEGEDSETVFKGGVSKETIPSAGAGWTETNDATIFCPLTSVVAVKYAPANADSGVTL